MNYPLKEKAEGKPRILVAPLDWGLGHATRCVPIIRELIVQGADVWLAGEGAQEYLLKTEFPQLPFLPLEGYRITYSRSAAGLAMGIFRQIHKIRSSIKKENGWLKKTVNEYHFDAVISDNRYGLYHSSVPCIFITHQLLIKSPLGKWTETILQRKNYRYINKFTACWIPDERGENNAAGQLSHTEKTPAVPLRYIGLLSRMDKKIREEKKGHLLFILSGPEPQRSMLENKIIAAINNYEHTATVIRGLPGAASLIPSVNRTEFYNHLTTAELNRQMLQAEYIISRSGYSTVMDIIALQKKSILIPTPGQTEQQYLGKYLMEKGIAFCIRQNDFSLPVALAAATKFDYQFLHIRDNDMLKKVIKDFFDSL